MSRLALVVWHVGQLLLFGMYGLALVWHVPGCSGTLLRVTRDLNGEKYEWSMTDLTYLGVFPGVRLSSMYKADACIQFLTPKDNAIALFVLLLYRALHDFGTLTRHVLRVQHESSELTRQPRDNVSMVLLPTRHCGSDCFHKYANMPNLKRTYFRNMPARPRTLAHSPQIFLYAYGTNQIQHISARHAVSLPSSTIVDCSIVNGLAPQRAV